MSHEDTKARKFKRILNIEYRTPNVEGNAGAGVSHTSTFTIHYSIFVILLRFVTWRPVRSFGYAQSLP
ncbi:MAG: hypothetical protein A2Z25_06585 [Planctomycetes bacterium RBG_16_55_9]|nr:MAG: hypothetical protein A2Z25_06585 [Planctomycetes bacterium RBG_16_55_9]